MIWDDERILRLLILVKQGLSARQIGVELSVSRNAVIGKIHRMGLSLARRPDSEEPVKRQKLERAVTAQVGDNRMKRIILARAIALDELPPYERIKSPAQSGRASVSLLDLKDEMCRWPIDGRDGSALRFCGCQRKHKFTPYCSRHHEIAYIGLPLRRNRDGGRHPRTNTHV